MLTTTVALSQHLARRCTSMAMCWRVERTDGRVYGFTSHDEDIIFEGVRYRAETGTSPSAISTKAGMQVDNTEAAGVLDSSAITEDDLRAGVWDHAELRVFAVNWRNLAAGAMKLRRGWLGQVSLKDQRYGVEVRGMMAALNASVGQSVTPACTAILGDSRCTKDLTDYTATGTVTAVSSNRVFDTDLPGATVRLTPSTTGNPIEGYFDSGTVTWVTGANAGLGMEVRAYAVTGEIGLQLPMTRDVEVGDTFTAVVGCAKSREVCIATFGNLANFRGFPDLPGIDKILRIGGQ